MSSTCLGCGRVLRIYERPDDFCEGCLRTNSWRPFAGVPTPALHVEPREEAASTNGHETGVAIAPLLARLLAGDVPGNGGNGHGPSTNGRREF